MLKASNPGDSVVITTPTYFVCSSKMPGYEISVDVMVLYLGAIKEGVVVVKKSFLQKYFLPKTITKTWDKLDPPGLKQWVK